MPQTTNYHSLSKFLHWSIVLLVAVQFMTAWIMPNLRRVSGSDIRIDMHMSFGLIIFPLAFCLLFMRYFRPVDKPELKAPTLQNRAALAMHYVLYVLLLILPWSGWAYASTHGYTVSYFGMFDLPMLVAKTSSLGRLFGGIHSALATVIGFLVLGHFAAALYHHFKLNDKVLVRMLPRFRRSPS